MRIFQLISIIICCSLSTIFSQSTLLNKADSLFSKAEYFDSITEYKRFLFFTTTHKNDVYVNNQIALAYKAGGFFENAIKHFTISKMAVAEPDQKFLIDLEIVKCNLLRKTSNRAITLLNNMAEQYPSDNYMKQIAYWKGWAYMFADNFELASEQFASVDSAVYLKNFCKTVVNQKYSVNFSKIISFLLPGAGHIYTGHYVQGILSLGWNVLWGYLSINAFMENRTLDGVLIGSLLWFRFYRGGIQSAARLAEIENLKITNNAMLYLQKYYKGEKP